LFKIDCERTPDVFVCGLQEIVDLNPKNLMMVNNSDKIAMWNKLVAENLSLIDSYSLVSSGNLVGIYMVIFAKKGMLKRISQLSVDVVKTGLGGKLGNKGAVVIKMFVDDSSFIFQCVHLAAGQNKVA
jgi:phosphatidylinositol-bisphosphatase